MDITMIPASSEDTMYNLHRAFVHQGFSYVDLQNTIQWETGNTLFCLSSSKPAIDFHHHISYILESQPHTINIEKEIEENLLIRH